MLKLGKKDVFYVGIVILLLLTIVGMRIFPKEPPEPIVYNIISDEHSEVPSEGSVMSSEQSEESPQAAEDAENAAPSGSEAVQRQTQTPSKISPGEPKININAATKAQLMRLPGIGEVTAQRIIDYRTQNGRFNSIVDIVKVSGIGDKKYQDIKDFIEVE